MKYFKKKQTKTDCKVINFNNGRLFEIEARTHYLGALCLDCGCGL